MRLPPQIRQFEQLLMIDFVVILACAFCVIVLLASYSKRRNRFFDAVIRGRSSEVESILNRNPVLAEHSKAIFWAVRWNQQAICEILIRHGCNVRERSVH